MTEKQLPLGTREVFEIMLGEGTKPEFLVEKYIRENPEAEEWRNKLQELVKEIFLVKNLEKANQNEKYFSTEESPGQFIPERLANDIMDQVKIITLNDNEDVYWFNEKEGL